MAYERHILFIYARYVPDICLASFTWHTKCARHMPGICQIYAWRIHGTYARHIQQWWHMLIGKRFSFYIKCWLFWIILNCLISISWQVWSNADKLCWDFDFLVQGMPVFCSTAASETIVSLEHYTQLYVYQVPIICLAYAWHDRRHMNICHVHAYA